MGDGVALAVREAPKEPPLPDDFSNWPPELQDAYPAAPVDHKYTYLCALAWKLPQFRPWTWHFPTSKFPCGNFRHRSLRRGRLWNRVLMP